MTSGARVTITGVSKRYGDDVALHETDLDIEPGTYVVVLGPSGSGKTTLLGILGGFTPPTTGRILIDGQDVTAMPPARRPTTTVFQDYALFPHMTVGENVGFGLTMRGVRGSRRRERVDEVLSMMGLEGMVSRDVASLSGGQRQRVALARALIVEPRVLLLDEPLGALDLKLRRQMQDELNAIHRTVGTTFVHVTHDQEEAMGLADVVVVLREGRIEDHGPPQRLYLRPATRFTATFMGDSNLLEGRVATASGDGSLEVDTVLGRVRVRGDAAPDDPVTLAVRPEHLLVDLPGPVVLGRGRLVEQLFFGTHQRCRVELNGQALTVHIGANRSFAPGQNVDVAVDPDDVVLLR